jgi:hypothetical protein
MRLRSEEEPEPDEDPGEAPAATAVPTPVVPAVAAEGREHEYRTELLTAAEVLDGSTLAERLTAASAEGWDLVDVIPAGDRHAVLLRRQKPPQRGPRPVGFAPPSG